MKAEFRNLRAEADSERRILLVRFELHNRSGEPWSLANGMVVGYQLFDPETDRFISEGEWTPLDADVPSGASTEIVAPVLLPASPGAYHVYVSLMRPGEGWAYKKGWPLVVLTAEVAGGKARLVKAVRTTLPALRRRKLGRTLRKLVALPVLTIARNWSLIRSMARRDVLSRYRGSFGDVFWTVLNPLLLMATYFFVFGVILRQRFGADESRSAYVLYFLAAMLPWLAMSEAIGRAPMTIWEHRNLVKKLVFPLETLNVTQVVAGFMTQAIGSVLFLAGLFAARGHIPATAAWLPVLIVPQLLFTLGICWFLAGLGAYLRDLGQLTGFLLTLWFFVTPICYAEQQLQQLPRGALWILGKNPVFTLVRNYRRLLLDGLPPDWDPVIKLWLLAVVTFLLGYAWFHKLRRTFADVI